MSSEKPVLFTVTQQDAGQRLDKYLSCRLESTRSQVALMIERGEAVINGAPSKPSYKVKPGDIVSASPHINTEGELAPEDMPLDILYMDEHLAVVDKPAGMVVYPAAGNPSGTLMNALKAKAARLATVGGPLRPGVVHRLDKDTSGVMVVALSDSAYYSLVEQFKIKSTDRNYIALLNGNLAQPEGTIDAPIGRSQTDRKKMSTRTRSGKDASTSYSVIERYPCACMVRAVLGTGRTHQIRVHFASVGHGVLGDGTYGRNLKLTYKGRTLSFPRQMLHAETLSFDHPDTGVRMTFRSEVPADMMDAIEGLRALC